MPPPSLWKVLNAILLSTSFVMSTRWWARAASPTSVKPTTLQYPSPLATSIVRRPYRSPFVEQSQAPSCFGIALALYCEGTERSTSAQRSVGVVHARDALHPQEGEFKEVGTLLPHV